MKWLFQPASALMSRLRYASKFSLLGMLALGAILVLQVSLFLALDRVIEPSRQELRGLDAIVRLNQVVQLVQQHRGLSAGLLGGDGGMKGAQRAKTDEVQQAFVRLAQSLPQNGIQVPRMQAVENDWHALRDNGLQWGQRLNTQRHEELIAKMILLSMQKQRFLTPSFRSPPRPRPAIRALRLVEVRRAVGARRDPGLREAGASALDGLV